MNYLPFHVSAKSLWQIFRQKFDEKFVQVSVCLYVQLNVLGFFYGRHHDVLGKLKQLK
jgi:hypothetical protein